MVAIAVERYMRQSGFLCSFSIFAVIGYNNHESNKVMPKRKSGTVSANALSDQIRNIKLSMFIETKTAYLASNKSHPILS